MRSDVAAQLQTKRSLTCWVGTYQQVRCTQDGRFTITGQDPGSQQKHLYRDGGCELWVHTYPQHSPASQSVSQQVQTGILSAAVLGLSLGSLTNKKVLVGNVEET